MSALLQVDGLSKHFGGLRAVHDLSFTCDGREILGIIGPNGAGKTTAINLISGFIAPSAGRVRFGDEQVTGSPPHRLAALGLVRTFQATTVFGSRSVRDNAMRGAFLRLYPGLLRGILGLPAPGARAVGDEVDQLLDMFGLTAHADALAGDLPYGLQKTLGMVIALAAKPRLLMLDEPVAGLNADESEQVRKVITRIHTLGIAVIVIDHNMRFMSGLCHRIVAMHHGQELAQGTPAEVLANAQVVEAYLGKAQHATA